MSRQITRVKMPESKYQIKCPYTMNADGICVHNTANKASAMAEISYMIGNNNSVSYHYAVDDYRIVQGVEENRNAWHAGDGKNGKGNRNRIAIEICYSTAEDESLFIKSELLCAEFIAYKLKEKGWGIERVSKHQDYSGKYCPHKTLDLGWERFLNLIREKLGQATVEITQATNTVKNTTSGTIATIQSTLNSRYGLSISVDDIFGPKTKRALVIALQTELNKQYNAGLKVDGAFGPKTKKACVNVKRGAKGNITYILQALLFCSGYSTNGVDGIFGRETENAVRQYQASSGLAVDGIAGRDTFAKLCA